MQDPKPPRRRWGRLCDGPGDEAGALFRHRRGDYSQREVIAIVALGKQTASVSAPLRAHLAQHRNAPLRR